METFAWIGIGVCAMAVAIGCILWIVGMLKDPIGRAILVALSILAVVAWGLAGGIYLIVEKT